MALADGPFIGSEARASGIVRKHELRSRYRAIFPDVYMPRAAVPTLRQRAEAAWLWSNRNGVVAGLTAAGLHGAKWVDDALPVELVLPNARAPEGLRTYRLRLDDDELRSVGGLPVTTPVRTAFDIGRRRPTVSTVAQMDALFRATGINVGAVAAIAARHPGGAGSSSARHGAKSGRSRRPAPRPG